LSPALTERLSLCAIPGQIGTESGAAPPRIVAMHDNSYASL